MTSPERPGTGPPLDFADWYAREFPRLRSTLALVTGDVGVAEEATAEAFARALVHWPRLSRTGAPNGWVYTVALNQVRSGWRRMATERRWLARQRAGHVAPPPEPDPWLWDAVARLGPRARTAVALRYVADLSEAEVADAMNLTRGAVASTLHKARARLAVLLADHAPDRVLSPDIAPGVHPETATRSPR